MSARNTVVRTTCAKDRPAASSSAPMFSRTRRVCAAMSPSTMRAGRRIERHLAGHEQQLAGAERGRVGPDRLRRESRAGDRRASRGLDDLARPEAARADADALDAAVDQCPDGLKVRLEPARADVVRVAELTADDRALSANFTTLGHCLSLRNRRRTIKYTGRAQGTIKRGGGLSASRRPRPAAIRHVSVEHTIEQLEKGTRVARR